jgi:Leucine-rich repeat (LRR) protein
LILNNNYICKIENLSENFYLEHLDLSFNQIEIIENLDGLRLQKLNLMNNKIRSISGLDNLETLLMLNLSKNLITRLKGLQGLANLRYLYLSSNQISRAKQVAYISELPFLTDVDFCYNDVQNRKFYRFQVKIIFIILKNNFRFYFIYLN